MPNALLYVLIAIAVLIVLIVVLRTIRARGSTDNQSGATPELVENHEEHDSLTDGFADAVEEVAGDFIGVETHPSAHPEGEAHHVPTAADGSDELTQIKGLGPKAAEKLEARGIVTFAQIAGWSDADVETIGGELGGSFAQRIARDRWVEQADLLARGETDTFEAEFGKLG